jgi:phosphoribosyl 1,2-cyclic phosphodiesterase
LPRERDSSIIVAGILRDWAKENGMALRFSVLASGSSGNAALLDADGFGVLIDVGLGPRILASRLAAVGCDWTHVHAVVLTHTHGDHWNERTLEMLRKRHVPLWCHVDHHLGLRQYSAAFGALRAANLVRTYEMGQPLELAPTLRCTPLPLSHDDTTSGFRFEASPDLFGHTATLGYVADSGCWRPALAAALADVDILALEFNHDVFMEKSSGRSPALIFRVLGDRGHLSNVQAAELLREVLRRSQPGRLRHLVQLHLSRQCNRPAMAVDAARVVLTEMGAEVAIHTASQHEAGPTLVAGGNGTAPRRGRWRTTPKKVAMGQQPLLPGWE